MTPIRAEFWLAILYTGSMIFSIVSIVSFVTAWQHWSWTLDSCYLNCGCILYGVNTYTMFLGGDVKICHFCTYSLVPVFVIGLCLGGFHGYRSCINKNLDDPKLINSDRPYANDESQVVVNVKRRNSYKQWIPAAFLGAFICFLSFAHVVVITDGYYKTCDQYRRQIIQLLGSRGREVQAIHNRLQCGAIFDFMDYIQPDNNNWSRGSEINTGIALQLAITTSWFNFFAWVAACLINLIMARKRLHSLEEKFCCCC